MALSEHEIAGIERRQARIMTMIHGEVSLDQAALEGIVIGVDVPRLIADLRQLRAAARALVMATTPFSSALELGGGSTLCADGEDLHRILREALGISEDEWRESPDR